MRTQDGSEIAQGVRLARLVMQVSKGSDAEGPEYLGAGGTWGLGTDLLHGAEVSE